MFATGFQHIALHLAENLMLCFYAKAMATNK